MPIWWGTGKTINVGVVPSRMLYIYIDINIGTDICVLLKKKRIERVKEGRIIGDFHSPIYSLISIHLNLNNMLCVFHLF